MTFKGIWSRATHPKDWPENGILQNSLAQKFKIFTCSINCYLEYLTHWSNIIAAVHSRNFSVWEYGGYATEGLRELAEYGITKVLEEELKNKVFFLNFAIFLNDNLNSINC